MITYFLRFSLWLGLIGFGISDRLHAAAPPESRAFQAAGVKLHYLAAGQGEPVILLHGLASSAEINWKLTGVIALDLPGHGQSDKPEKESAYGKQVVEDVVLLMDHLKIQKAHIVGYSIGGWVRMHEK
jgi:pimeloyl-ACP methyl ester carboxylesterase